MLLESDGFDAVPVTRLNNFVSLHKLDRDKLKHLTMILLVTGIATKPLLSVNMFPKIKTCENGRSNFSKNLRIVALILMLRFSNFLRNLIELTRFLSPNLSIYIYLL